MADQNASGSQVILEKPSSTVSANSTLKSCAMCGLEIPSNAQKCFHCGSYQRWSWKRLFGVLNPVAILSLLIALVSVLGTAAREITVYLDYIREPVPMLRFTLIPPIIASPVGNGGMKLSASIQIDNFGKGAGSVGRVASWYIPFTDSPNSAELQQDEDILLLPGESKRVTYAIALSRDASKKLIGNSWELRSAEAGRDITLRMVEIAGKSRASTYVPCDYVADTINAFNQ